MPTVLAAMLSACAALPAPTPPPPASTPAEAALPEAVAGAPEEAAPALIAAERQAAIDGDMQTLAALWAPYARIIDGRGTADPGDDYTWTGRDAILDRYALAVLPSPPPPLEPSSLDALEVYARSGDEVRADLGIDRWTLTWQEGRWWLAELQYN